MNQWRPPDPFSRFGRGILSRMFAASAILLFSIGFQPELRAQAEEFAEVYSNRYVEPGKDLLLGVPGEKKGHALASYYLGLSREKAGDIEGALEAFERVLEVSPEQLLLANKAASIAGQFGEIDRGREILEKTFEKNRNVPAAYLSLSDFLATYHKGERKHIDRSTAVMEEAGKRFPDTPEIYDRLITSYLKANQKQKARETLTSALERENDTPEYWLDIARVAQRIYPLRGDDPPVVINGIYEKALRLGKGKDAIESAVADYYSLTHQFDRARVLYEAILAKHPEELTVREKLARVYSLLGDQDKVLETLVELEQINPHRLETQKFIARIYQERKDFDNAIKHWQKAFKIERGEIMEYLEVGWMMMVGNHGQEAAELLERAQFHYPESLEISVMLSRAYNAARNYERAFESFKQTEPLLAQSRPDLLDSNYYFSYGAAAERTAQFDAAADLFRKSIDLVPEQEPTRAAMAYNYLGYMWLEQDKNIDEAGQLIIMANDLIPDSGAYVDSLGWFYFKKGDFPKALKTLIRSEKMMTSEEGYDADDPENAVIYDHIAQAYFQLGHRDKALELMQKAVALDPKKEEFAKRLKEYTDADPPEKVPLDFLEPEVAPKVEDTPPKPKPESETVPKAA